MNIEASKVWTNDEYWTNIKRLSPAKRAFRFSQCMGYLSNFVDFLNEIRIFTLVNRIYLARKRLRNEACFVFFSFFARNCASPPHSSNFHALKFKTHLLAEPWRWRRRSGRSNVYFVFFPFHLIRLAPSFLHNLHFPFWHPKLLRCVLRCAEIIPSLSTDNDARATKIQKQSNDFHLFAPVFFASFLTVLFKQ